jgi:hypothetical protein
MNICKKCNHKNNIPGVRFCTSCGNPLKQPAKKLPEKNVKETIKEVQIGTLSENMSDTLFMGTEIHQCPLFVSHSGKWLWHVKGDLEPIELNDIPQNRILGFVHKEDIAPWVVIAWSKCVILFNTFTDDYQIIWKAPSNDVECMRLPAAQRIGQMGEENTPYIRFLLLIQYKKEKKMRLVTTNLLLQKIKYPGEWILEKSKTIQSFDLKAIQLILNPLWYDNQYYYFVVIPVSKQPGKPVFNARLIPLTNEFKFDLKNMKKLRLGDKNIKNMPALTQLDIQDNIFFWAYINKNPWLIHLSLKDNSARPFMIEKDMADLDKSSYLCKVLCDRKIAIAMLDKDDKLLVKRRAKWNIDKKFTQARLSSFFKFMSSGNMIYAIGEDRDCIIKYTFKDNFFEETKVVKSSKICSNLVHANHRIYYLTLSSEDNFLRVESIK